MCAITGIISPISTYNQISLLDPMLSSMLHRGPDATATTSLGKEGCFGHNRLAIIDLAERAKQPIWNASRRFCLIFNGEIYNYQHLKIELTQRGHRFCTESDSEVLIEAWAEWGIKAIHRLVGMFAFAVWDNQLKKLFLVRDRMGEKPLFYAPIQQNLNNGLVFASELKGLMQYPFITKNLSMTALNHYLSFGYISTEDAIFKNIYKLPPAAYLVYDATTYHYSISYFWSLANYFNNKKIISFPDAQAELDLLLKNSVKKQSISDVPLGAFLSGGIDSSSIVAHMNENQGNQVNTYSIGFKEKTYNELNMSQKISQYLSVKHHTKILSSIVWNDLIKIISVFDEPFADTSLIPTYLLCKFARQQVKVSLSGDGGDELFGGYVTYQANRYHGLMQFFPRTARKLMVNSSYYLPTSFNKVSLDYKIKKFLQGCLLDHQDAHISWREIFNQQEKQALFRREFNNILEYNPINAKRRWFSEVVDCHRLDQAMYVDMKTWLVDDILVKVDRASMAHSLEVRAPFLDHSLVEFAASLPINYKIAGFQGKRILKASQKKRLPAYVIHQTKKGFNSPISSWLSTDLFDMAYDLTTTGHLNTWFNKEYIETLWSEHKNGRRDHGYRLFNLLCLEIWCQNYL